MTWLEKKSGFCADSNFLTKFFTVSTFRYVTNTRDTLLPRFILLCIIFFRFVKLKKIKINKRMSLVS